MTTETQTSRLAKALLETADDMRRVGIMDNATHAKITERGPARHPSCNTGSSP